MLLTSAVMLSCKSSDDEPTPHTAEVQPIVETYLYLTKFFIFHFHLI